MTKNHSHDADPIPGLGPGPPSPETKRGGKHTSVVIQSPTGRSRDSRPKRSRLTIADVSSEDLRLVSETSFECIECVESLISKAKSIHAPDHLRDLSLTLATLERQLYNYVCDHLLRSRKFLPRPGSSAMRLAAKNTKRTLQGALMRAHDLLDDGHIPLICGGVASLLHNLKGSLLETKAVVNELSHFLYTTPRDAAYVSGYLALAGLGAYRVSSWLNVSLQVLSATRRARWDGPMAKPLGIQLNVRGGAGRRMSVIVHFWRRASGWFLRKISWRCRMALAGLIICWLIHRGMRARAMAKLRECNRQLLLLQRIMGCVLFALDEAQMRRAKSYVELVAYPSLGVDFAANARRSEAPAARLLVESVAYPTSPYLYQYTHGRHYILKKALDLMYSTMGTAWDISGGRWYLTIPLAQLAAPYFLTHPERASSYATGVRQHMSPEFFRFLCWTGNNNLTRYLSLVVLMRTFVTRCRLKIPKLPHPTYIFQKSGNPPPCARIGATVGRLPWQLGRGGGDGGIVPIPKAMPKIEGGPVLLYVYGGGFCANLMTMDLPFIKTVAEGVPRATIVVSEYSEAPEHPFPTALDEICITYEWIRAGGLGYRPSRVILAGESAGGNLVAAMCVRYVAAHNPDLAVDAGGADPALRAKLGIGPEPAVHAPLPDAIILGYPAMNLGASPSPSRALHMCDPVLPIAAGNLAKAYHRDTEGLMLNPQVSPSFTSDAVLAHFPPTSIMTGGMDILLDDAVDFHVRLRRNGVQGNFRIFRTMPHGFWSLGDFLPEAQEAQRTALRWIRRALYPHPPPRTSAARSRVRVHVHTDRKSSKSMR